GRVVRKIRCQLAEQVAPTVLVPRKFGLSCAMHRQCAKLHEKHMPSWRLVRAQGGEAVHIVARQRGEQAGKGKKATRRGGYEGLGEEICRIRHDFSLLSPWRS